MAVKGIHVGMQLQIRGFASDVRSSDDLGWEEGKLRLILGRWHVKVKSSFVEQSI
jgi:hypothetical protein